MRLVALGRRVDGSASQTFAADGDWRRHLPDGQWVHLAATFDFDTGEMVLYRNGRALPGSYVRDDDPWALAGDPEPDLASPTDPRGIKIGGSFPQNTREANPCNCRMDDLLFLNRAATALPGAGRVPPHRRAPRVLSARPDPVSRTHRPSRSRPLHTPYEAYEGSPLVPVGPARPAT